MYRVRKVLGHIGEVHDLLDSVLEKERHDGCDAQNQQPKIHPWRKDLRIKKPEEFLRHNAPLLLG